MRKNENMFKKKLTHKETAKLCKPFDVSAPHAAYLTAAIGFNTTPLTKPAAVPVIKEVTKISYRES